jgi:hypothetical protein
MSQCLVLRGFLILTAHAAVLLAQRAAQPSFDTTSRPVFVAKCIACHGAASAQGDLDLGTPEAVLKGGKSGPSVVSGAAAKSLLIDKIVTGQMPRG